MGADSDAIDKTFEYIQTHPDLNKTGMDYKKLYEQEQLKLKFANNTIHALSVTKGKRSREQVMSRQGMMGGGMSKITFLGNSKRLLENVFPCSHNFMRQCSERHERFVGGDTKMNLDYFY